MLQHTNHDGCISIFLFYFLPSLVIYKINLYQRVVATNWLRLTPNHPNEPTKRNQNISISFYHAFITPLKILSHYRYSYWIGFGAQLKRIPFYSRDLLIAGCDKKTRADWSPLQPGSRAQKSGMRYIFTLNARWLAFKGWGYIYMYKGRSFRMTIQMLEGVMFFEGLEWGRRMKEIDCSGIQLKVLRKIIPFFFFFSILFICQTIKEFLYPFCCNWVCVCVCAHSLEIKKIYKNDNDWKLFIKTPFYQ